MEVDGADSWKDMKLRKDMKGVSPVVAASVVAGIGNIIQFETAIKLQSYAANRGHVMSTKLMLPKAVEHYNEERLHSSLGYMTPSELRNLKEMETRQ